MQIVEWLLSEEFAAKGSEVGVKWCWGVFSDIVIDICDMIVGRDLHLWCI